MQLTKTPPQRVVQPRDAASLVLIRQEGGESEVLLGRRSSTMAFMPNAYVFPGGTVEPDDRQVWPVSQLNLDIIPHLAVGGDANRAHALAIAAIRETCEETGLMLGQPGEVGPVAA